MGRPRIGFDNYCRRPETRDLVTATAGSSASNAPPSRLLSEDLTELWQSAYGVSSTWIQVTLDGAEEIDTVVLPQTNLRPGSEWRVRIGTGDLTNPANCTHDTGLIEAGVIDPYGTPSLYLDTPVIGETVRIDLSDMTVDPDDPEHDCLECGRVWIAKSWRPDRNFELTYSELSEDLSTKTRSLSGQMQVDRRQILRGYSLRFGVMTGADKDEARRLRRICGSSQEILVCFQDDSPLRGEEIILGMPTDQPITGHPSTGQISAWTLEVMEMT